MSTISMVFRQFSYMIGQTEEVSLPNNSMDSSTPVEEKNFLCDLDKHLNRSENDETMRANEKSENLTRVAGFGVGVGSLYLQEALGYPFLVLRRQCQVNVTGMKHHILPFSLFPVINKIHQRQGMSVFWKGWGSACIVNGVTIATEILIFELCNVKRGKDEKRLRTKAIVVHKLLKGCSLLLTLPLISTSLMDSVQTLVLHQPRFLFTFVKDAFYRLIGLYVSRGHGKLLPFYSLVLPSIVYGVLRYSVKTLLASYIIAAHSNSRKQEANGDDSGIRMIYYSELVSNCVSSLLTDLLMYPFETCLLRLHLQGTATIIDDTDKGYGVVPLCTNYDGMMDCFRETYAREGCAGFYRGFGGLLLQYTVHFFIIKVTKLLYRTAT